MVASRQPPPVVSLARDRRRRSRRKGRTDVARRAVEHSTGLSERNGVRRPLAHVLDLAASRGARHEGPWSRSAGTGRGRLLGWAVDNPRPLRGLLSSPPSHPTRADSGGLALARNGDARASTVATTPSSTRPWLWLTALGCDQDATGARPLGRPTPRDRRLRGRHPIGERPRVAPTRAHRRGGARLGFPLCCCGGRAIRSS